MNSILPTTFRLASQKPGNDLHSSLFSNNASDKSNNLYNIDLSYSYKSYPQFLE